MSLATFQSDLQAALVAGAGHRVPAVADALTGLTILLELDDDATAEELAAQDAALATALNRSGIVAVITYPRAARLDAAKGTGGAVHLGLISQIGLLENPAVNRSAADPATPDIVPANKRPLDLMRAVIVAVLAAGGFEFPAQPLAAPETDLEGINLYAVLVLGKDDIRA